MLRIVDELGFGCALPVMAGDGSVGSLRFDSFAIWTNQDGSHEAERTVALRNNVRLHVTVVVFAWPNECTIGFECLSDHVVNETVLIPDLGLFELRLVVPENDPSISL